MRSQISGLRPSYVSTDYGQVHLRSTGTGSPVVILHDVPGSSAGVDRCLVEQLAAERTVVIPDLIGSGGTTVQDDLAADLDVQADVLASVLRALGIDSAPLVGDGAGAAVAFRLRERAPGLVTGVAALSSPPACMHVADMPQAPPIDSSGTHLIRLFDEVRNSFAFSPWWHATAETRRHRGLPGPDVLHAVMLDTAAHGIAHQRIIGAASQYWDSIAVDVNSGITVLSGDVGADIETILTLPEGTGIPSLPDDIAGAGERRGYALTRVGPVHLRLAGFEHEAVRPILLLHANPGSGQGLEGLARVLGRTRPAIVWDTPGHGRSVSLQTETPSMDGTYAPLLLDVLDQLGVERCDVYGTHTGAALATELAILAPDRVGGVVLDGVPLFDDDPDLVASVLENYFVDLTLDTHGSQIRRAWGATADMALWWPWFNHSAQGARDTNPYPAELLHTFVLDMLRSAPHYNRSYRAAWRWQATRRLPMMSRPALVGSTPTDPLAAMTPRSLELLEGRGTEVVFAGLGAPGAAETNAAAITRFLATID